MESGRTGGVMALDALIAHPDSLSAARLTGCKNFFPVSAHDGGLEILPWQLFLPGVHAAPDAATLALMHDAIDFGGQAHEFRVRRVIPDVDCAIVLLSPAQLNADAPTLRVEFPLGTAPETGSTLRLSFRPEALRTF